MPAGSSCAAYADGYPAAQAAGSTGFDPPSPDSKGTTGLFVSVSLPSGYHGPGTYASSPSTPMTGGATVAVQAAEGPTYYVFRSGASGVISFTVAGDGSGSLQFSSWRDTETRGGNGTGVLDGTMTWTCR